MVSALVSPRRRAAVAGAGAGAGGGVGGGVGPGRGRGKGAVTSTGAVGAGASEAIPRSVSELRRHRGWSRDRSRRGGGRRGGGRARIHCFGAGRAEVSAAGRLGGAVLLASVLARRRRGRPPAPVCGPHPLPAPACRVSGCAESGLCARQRAAWRGARPGRGGFGAGGGGGAGGGKGV
ncbi:hypothetical protein B484DRAFT_253066 [Ochromonadaceae sp. CCMP2298]|nr:hypothetical protein B484DRAFT_253066 [Ochromonadaceae sp. CCMP2298]